MSQITGGAATKVAHALSTLEDNFSKQKADQAYSLKADGGGISLSQFYGGNKLLSKPTQIVATVVGGRRTQGARKSDSAMQSAMGNLGDHERALFGRDARKTYEGGHLISDKILGTDSYVEHNFVPMHTDVNAPDYRNCETKAEVGLVDKKTLASRTDIPLTMTVDVVYMDDPFTISLVDLVAHSVIPSTFTKTDTGGGSITFPRRVPTRITAKLEYDTAKYPDVCFPESSVGTVSDGRMVGTTDNLDNNYDDLEPASQEAFWGMDSVHDKGGTSYTGGGTGEQWMAIQPIPQPIAKQPKFTGGKKKAIARKLPLAVPVSIFGGPIKLSELDDETSAAFAALLKAEGPYAKTFSKAVKRRKNTCAFNKTAFSRNEMVNEVNSLKTINQKKRGRTLLDDPNMTF